MPITRKRAVNNKRLYSKIQRMLSRKHSHSHSPHSHINRARIMSKINFDFGGAKMINVVEKKNSPVTYSTSHNVDWETNEKNIQNLLKRHAKLLKRLAE